MDLPDQMQMDKLSQGLYQQHLPPASMSNYYMQQPGHILVNPPHLPTYNYGIPPSPMVYHNQGYPPGSLPMTSRHSPSPPHTPLRRAGSINAKIYSAEARRPFANPRAASESMYGHPGQQNGYGQQGNGFVTHNGQHAIENQSVVDHLRKNQINNEENFMEKIKDWETNTQLNYNVRKVEDEGELPGLMIEEMMESASMVNGGTEEINKEKAESQVNGSVLGDGQFSAALAVPQKAPLKWKQSTPLNTAVMFVPQQEAWLVERMGKYHRTLEPGMNVLIPIIDKVRYVQSLKEIAIDIPHQTAVTSDNVPVAVDGVLFLHINDPYKASYEVEDPEYSIIQLAQTSTRSELGKIGVDGLFKERENLNSSILKSINTASENWGILCIRYEVRDMKLPMRVQEAMQMQVEAERKKRAAVLESEGIMAAEINVAEGKKQARILASEAEKQELINAAQGTAQAVVAAGEARAKSIEIVAKALGNENGGAAASLAVAEKYVTAFGQIAKESTTIMLPANAGDVGSMVAQAMSIYGKLGTKTLPTVQEEQEDDTVSPRHISEVNINLD